MTPLPYLLTLFIVLNIRFEIVPLLCMTLCVMQGHRYSILLCNGGAEPAGVVYIGVHTLEHACAGLGLCNTTPQPL